MPEVVAGPGKETGEREIFIRNRFLSQGKKGGVMLSINTSRGKVYTRQREIEETYCSIASQTQQHILQMIKLVHDSNQESPMFERVVLGGSLFGTATEHELHSWCV